MRPSFVLWMDIAKCFQVMKVKDFKEVNTMAINLIRNYMNSTTDRIIKNITDKYFTLKYSYRLWLVMKFSLIPAFKRAVAEALANGREVVYTTFFAPSHLGAMIAENPQKGILINVWETIIPSDEEAKLLEAPEISLEQCWKIQHKLERKLLLPLFLKMRKKHQLKVLF